MDTVVFVCLANTLFIQKSAYHLIASMNTMSATGESAFP